MSSPSPIVHVVDDDELVRTALGNLLSASGYEVRTYGSATEFLLSAPKDNFGCIVLDVLMPGPSGLDLHETLMQKGDVMPVIYLSGHGDIPMSVSAMKAGAVDFLTKPVDKVRLLKAVKEALARNARSRTADAELKILQQRRDTLSARIGRIQKGRSRLAQQADCGRAWDLGTYRQSAARPCHGEDAGEVAGRPGANGRPARISDHQAIKRWLPDDRAGDLRRLPSRATNFPKVPLPVRTTGQSIPVCLVSDVAGRTLVNVNRCRLDSRW
jgi:FixJ family two-component response regulator